MNTNTSVTSPTPTTPSSSPSSPEQGGPSPGAERDSAALALASKVQTGARELTDEAKQIAGDVASQAKKTAETSITSGKARAAESLGDVADALRQAGEHLRSQDKTSLTDYVVRAADKVDAASFYLQRRTLSDVLGDVGGLARREPALFLGGAFALGLLGGRFLKSSGSRPAAASGSHSASSPKSGADSRTSGAGSAKQSQERNSNPGNRGTEAKVPGAM